KFPENDFKGDTVAKKRRRIEQDQLQETRRDLVSLNHAKEHQYVDNCYRKRNIAAKCKQQMATSIALSGKDTYENSGTTVSPLYVSLFDPLKKRRVTWDYVGESGSADQDLSRGRATFMENVTRTVVLDRKTETHLHHSPVEESKSLRSTVEDFNEIKLQPGLIVHSTLVATFEMDQDALKATAEVKNGTVALQSWVHRKGVGRPGSLWNLFYNTDLKRCTVDESILLAFLSIQESL
ncbi:beta-fructofuranosidase, soluble isoenzyme I-like protein, partial [Tanacetum coccineum]